MPNPPQLVETGFTGGLMQRTAEAAIPFGELTIAKNVRQTKNGLLGKRPGNTKLTNQYQKQFNHGAATLSTPGALSAHGNQLLITTNDGTAPYSAARGTFDVIQPSSEALVTRSIAPIPQQIMAFTQLDYLMAPAMATDGTYYFYCWVTSGNVLGVSIEEIATGEMVQLQVDPTIGDTVLWAVPLVFGGQFSVVYLDGSGNAKLVSTPSPYTAWFPTWTTTTLNTGVGGAMISAVAADASHIAVAEINGSGAMVVKTFTLAGAAVASSSAYGTSSILDVRLSLGSGLLWLGGAKTAAIDVIALDPTALTTAMTGVFAALSTDHYVSFALLAQPSSRCVVAYSAKSGSTSFVYTSAALVDATLSAGAGGFVVDGTANHTAHCVLASAPIQQGTKVYFWTQNWNDNGVGSAPIGTEYSLLNPNEWTYVLVDSRLDYVSTGYEWDLRPVAVTTPRFALPVGNKYITALGTTLAPLSIASPVAGKYVIVGGVRQTAYVSVWNKIAADFTSTSRWKSVELGGLQLRSSGMISNWDGAYSFENGFLNFASMGSTSIAVSSGGGLTASKDYYYKVVPIWMDLAGQLHRGIPSELEKGTTTSSNKTITLNIPTVTQTIRSAKSAAVSSVIVNPVFYEIYRSQPSPASSGNDVATNFIDFIAATYGDVVTYTDTGAVITDAVAATGALCYTFGGALPNGCPPGGLDIVVHQGRAWVLSDDGQNWYFSKQVVGGEAVNFTDSFTQPTDDAGGVGGASMDDKLIVFTNKKIYYQTGLGPADNGSNSDYQGFVRIQSPVGCSDRRSIVVTPDGTMFQSPIGIYLLDRGLNVTYVGQPVADELAAYPVVVAAVLHPSQPWVYFYVTNVAGNAGERIVYDYRVQRWYTDTLPGVPVSATSTGDGTHYWLDTTGQVWKESNATCLDDGSYVVSQFETTMHAVGIDGWQNIARCQLLFSRLTPHDVTIETRSMYGASYDTPATTFTDAQLSAMQNFQGSSTGVGQVEFCPVSSKTNAIAVRVTDAAPTGGGSLGTGQGANFFALAFMTQPDPATMSLVADQQRG